MNLVKGSMIDPMKAFIVQRRQLQVEIVEGEVSGSTCGVIVSTLAYNYNYTLEASDQTFSPMPSTASRLR